MLPPMVNHDLFGVKLKKVQSAAPDDQPDDAVAFVRRQLAKALGGTLQDRLTGAFEGPRTGSAADQNV